MKGLLIKILKLLFVAALMWYVAGKVQWGDRIAVTRDNGKVLVRETPGEIVGPWNLDVVRFRESGKTEAVEVQDREVLADGSVKEVQPGFLTYWGNVNGWLFALGAFCYFLTVLIAGARWWWLLRVNGTDVTLGETLRYTWIGVFFNSAMLGATGGDVIKALYIMKRCPGHRVEVLVSVVVDRVLGLASLAVLGAVMVLFALDRFGDIAPIIWGIIAVVALMFAVAFSKRLRSLVRLKPLLDRLPARITNLLRLVDQAVFFYRGHKRVIVASLVAGVGNHVVSVLSVVFIGDALGVEMPWFQYFVMIPVINIITALPISPNGWGLGEGLYQWWFSTFGSKNLAIANAAHVMGTRGVALSVLYRLHLTLWSLLGGVFVLFEKDRVTKDDIRHEVELEEQGPPAGGNGGA